MDYESVGIWALIVGAISAFVWLMRNLPWSHTPEGKQLAAQALLVCDAPNDSCEEQRFADPLFEHALRGDPQAQRLCGMRKD